MTWDAEAATWDSDAAVRKYAEAAFASLEEMARQHGAPLARARVCDFGCGTGLLTEKLADRCAGIHAVDSSGAMLEVLEAKIHRKQWTHVRTFSQLPGTEATYDLVVCSSVCAFLEDYPGTVARLARRLEPGGLFLQWDWELDPTDEEPFGLSRAGIRQSLQAAGLEVLTVDTAFAVPVEDKVMSPLLGVGRRPAG